MLKNMGVKALAFSTILGMAACTGEQKTELQANVEATPETIAAESAKANKFFDEVFDAAIDRSPMYQTYMGIKKDQDKWGDISLENERKELEISEESLARLKKEINYNLLDEQTRLSYDLFVQQVEDEMASEPFMLYDYPVNQMFGLQSEMPSLLINMHRISNEEDALAYIARLEKVKPLFEQLVGELKRREEAGIMPPKFVFEHVIRDSYNIIQGVPFEETGDESTLWADFSKKVNALEIPAEKKESLMDKARNAMLKGVEPGYQTLIATLEDQKTRATDDAGAWKFPKGEEFYNARLKEITTTDLTADEIHEIGLREVARIHDEMNAIKDKVGFEGSLQEFFTFMREDEQFYYADSEEGRKAYMEKATAIINTMKSRLDELFITKPKADMIVKAVEPFREKSAGKAFYQQPAPDGSRPGTYYANMYNMEEMPKYQMEALAYHEGIPGHHMQISIAMELGKLPKFRKYGRYTAYVEGWGLYSEMIPKEMGLYENPYSDFGRLAMELWRACRLVVDTGIHAKKWTREQGIAYYTDNTPNAKGDAVKMVERHIVMPAQATAYLIGKLKLVELREMAKEKLGEQFDIREFHDVVLTSGPLPLNVVEEKVNNWIASKAV